MLAGGEDEGEGGAFAGLALHLDAPPVQLQHAAGDGETQAEAARGVALIAALEAVENVGQRLRRDALTLISHGNVEEVSHAA